MTTTKPATATPRPIDNAPHGYQPSKAELEEEVPMPGLSREQARAAFMRTLLFDD